MRRTGWRWVIAGLSVAVVAVLVVTLFPLPAEVIMRSRFELPAVRPTIRSRGRYRVLPLVGRPRPSGSTVTSMSSMSKGVAMGKLAVSELREQVRAPIITADDPGYDEARAVHNGMFDRRPLGDRAGRAGRRRHRRGELRPRRRPGSVGPRRRAQRARVRHERRRGGHRPVADAARARRSARRARPAPAAARPGGTSTTRRTPTGWRRPAGSSPPPASAA